MKKIYILVILFFLYNSFSQEEYRIYAPASVSSYINGIDYRAINPVFTNLYSYSGGEIKVAGNSYPNNNFLNCLIGNISGHPINVRYSVRFALISDSFELFVKSGGKWFLEIDNIINTNILLNIPANGNFYYSKIEFSDWKYREIGLVSVDGAPFGGIAINKTNTIYKIGNPRKKLIVVGDSFSENNNVLGYTTFLEILSNKQLDVWPSALGGTGYINTYGERTNFLGRIFSDCINYNPEIVILAGGINDGNYNKSNIYDAVFNTIQSIKTNLPNTKIVVLGPFYPRTPDFNIIEVKNSIKLAAINANVNFIDNIEPFPWITGNRLIENSGNAVWATSYDNTHPTQNGHIFLAQKIINELKLLGWIN